MRVFIQNMIKQSGYFRGHLVIKFGDRKIQVAQKIGIRISLITELRAALAIFLEVRKLSGHSAVMNARESDILAENVPRVCDLKVVTRQERKTIVDVRGVRTRLVISLHT